MKGADFAHLLVSPTYFIKKEIIIYLKKINNVFIIL